MVLLWQLSSQQSKKTATDPSGLLRFFEAAELCWASAKRTYIWSIIT
jgi:hypothetical protein